MSFLQTKQIQSWILKSGSYLRAPQLDGPVEGGANEQVGEVQRPRSCVAADPRDGPVVALEHLANARFAVAAHRRSVGVSEKTDRQIQFSMTDLISRELQMLSDSLQLRSINDTRRTNKRG